MVYTLSIPDESNYKELSFSRGGRVVAEEKIQVGGKGFIEALKWIKKPENEIELLKFLCKRLFIVHNLLEFGFKLTKSQNVIKLFDKNSSDEILDDRAWLEGDVANYTTFEVISSLIKIHNLYRIAKELNIINTQVGDPFAPVVNNINSLKHTDTLVNEHQVNKKAFDWLYYKCNASSININNWCDVLSRDHEKLKNLFEPTKSCMVDIFDSAYSDANKLLNKAYGSIGNAMSSVYNNMKNCLSKDNVNAQHISETTRAVGNITNSTLDSQEQNLGECCNVVYPFLNVSFKESKDFKEEKNHEFVCKLVSSKGNGNHFIKIEPDSVREKQNMDGKVSAKEISLYELVCYHPEEVHNFFNNANEVFEKINSHDTPSSGRSNDFNDFMSFIAGESPQDV